MITDQKKEELFEALLELEKLSETEPDADRNYFERAEGASEMLAILGIYGEYVEWSFGK